MPSRRRQTGGWRGVRPFRVARKAVESSEITSFYLAPVDGGPVIAHQAGQYIGLQLQIAGTEHRRNYSLSAAADGVQLRISVKREAGGVVSGYLHDQVVPGDTLQVYPPAGHFTLQPGNKPLVLISGGVGITPTLAMLSDAIPSGRPIHFIHCARNHQVHAFKDAVDALAKQHPQVRAYYCYEHSSDYSRPHATGWLDQQILSKWLPDTRDVDAHFLRPKPFMVAVKRNLQALGVPPQQTHYESASASQ